MKVQEFPTPRSVKEFRSFLGTANWLREYVPRFAELAAPITELLQKGEFVWTPEADAAFIILKQKLSEPLKLSRPDPALRFTLQADASSIGMGAVLYQEDNGR